jgi:hypothetical protein
MDFNVDAAYKVDTVALKSKNRIWNQYRKAYFLDTVKTIATPC